MPVLVEEWTKGVKQAKSKGKKSKASGPSGGVVSKSSRTLVTPVHEGHQSKDKKSQTQASSELAFKLAKDDSMVLLSKRSKCCDFLTGYFD